MSLRIHPTTTFPGNSDCQPQSKNLHRSFNSELPQNWKTFIDSERYLNGGSRTYSQIANFSQLQHKYQPQSEIKSFSIPSTTIPKSLVDISLANPDPKLLSEYIHPRTVQFLIHPQFYNDQNIPHTSTIL